MAVLVSKISGGPVTIGINWVSRFLHRHPEIHTKVGIKIDAQRLQNATPAVLETWFAKLKGIQTDRQVDPADIWNMDETGIALGVCINQTVRGAVG
jgi:hypothetical protein